MTDKSNFKNVTKNCPKITFDSFVTYFGEKVKHYGETLLSIINQK